MPAMYKATGAPPVVGGLVRSGMGTRLARVQVVLAYGAGHVCGVLPLGHLSPVAVVPPHMVVRAWGPQPVPHRWLPPGNTQCSGYGHRSLRWVQVHATGYRGWHPVAAHCPLPGMPV